MSILPYGCFTAGQRLLSCSSEVSVPVGADSSFPPSPARQCQSPQQTGASQEATRKMSLPRREHHTLPKARSSADKLRWCLDCRHDSYRSRKKAVADRAVTGSTSSGDREISCSREGSLVGAGNRGCGAANKFPDRIMNKKCLCYKDLLLASFCSAGVKV